MIVLSFHTIVKLLLCCTLLKTYIKKYRGLWFLSSYRLCKYPYLWGWNSFEKFEQVVCIKCFQKVKWWRGFLIHFSFFLLYTSTKQLILISLLLITKLSKLSPLLKQIFFFSFLCFSVFVQCFVWILPHQKNSFVIQKWFWQRRLLPSSPS